MHIFILNGNQCKLIIVKLVIISYILFIKQYNFMNDTWDAENNKYQDDDGYWK